MAKPKVLSGIDIFSKALSDTKIITDFDEANKVKSNSVLTTIERDVSPMGVSYTLTGDASKELSGNNLFAQYRVPQTETAHIYAYAANYVNDVVTVKTLAMTPFTVSSGQFGNPELPISFVGRIGKDDFCHPDIAYDPIGVAGYKYWMVASILPGLHVDDAAWEDEDLFVSNDAVTWLRVKSCYEDAKTYTAPGLSLPPQTLATTNSRKHAFLPMPAEGDQIEISTPADNGAEALDRVTITLTDLPFKHDPAILIDGGYIYVYHTFHLRCVDRPGGRNRFIVCVRTNDGVNWESVRNDGSTLPITEETSRQLFTKDAEDRYNYFHYTYNTSQSSPCMLKYGEGDYEFIYGYNYSKRYKATNPYNVDFTQEYTFHNVGSSNHPDLLIDGSNLYLINNEGLYISTNRGENFTKYDYPPYWLGGLTGMSYKKSFCKGIGDKIILVEAQRQSTTGIEVPYVNGFASTGQVHQLYITQYDSIADLVAKAQSGITDGYIDIQILKVNFENKNRNVRLYPYISNLNTTFIVNQPLQRIKIADIDVVEGDILYFCVTLNSRHGAKIVFGGIEIS